MSYKIKYTDKGILAVDTRPYVLWIYDYECKKSKNSLNNRINRALKNYNNSKRLRIYTVGEFRLNGTVKLDKSVKLNGLGRSVIRPKDGGFSIKCTASDTTVANTSLIED